MLQMNWVTTRGDLGRFIFGQVANFASSKHSGPLKYFGLIEKI